MDSKITIQPVLKTTLSLPCLVFEFVFRSYELKEFGFREKYDNLKVGAVYVLEEYDSYFHCILANKIAEQYPNKRLDFSRNYAYVEIVEYKFVGGEDEYLAKMKLVITDYDRQLYDDI